MTIAVVAEKPSVGRDIAAVLGATRRLDGFFEGGGYIVTWAIGHLVVLAQPHEIDPAWKRWSIASLPMLPTAFPLVVVAETKAQFEVVRKILRSRAVDEVVCATDAGREGELIFRYVYEAAGCTKPVRRLWISSLTPEAIRNGFGRLKSASEYDRLADAARGRNRADWLVGMNLSRVYSLTLDQHISVGRVQTPTLAILVDRELAIRAFVPEDYFEAVATFRPASRVEEAAVTYEGTWSRPRERGKEATTMERRRLPPDGDEANAIVRRALAGRSEIESLEAETRKLPPPLLYDLTELQRHANRLYGMSAQKTLDVLQALYERHKLISYPRTDSRHLSNDVAVTLGAVVRAIEHRYAGLVAKGTGTIPLGRRFVDDARVTDHHAIIPTTTGSRSASLSGEEEKLYDLVCRRLLQAWHADHVYAVTNVVTMIASQGEPRVVDRYESQGTAVEQVGWKVLDVGAKGPASSTDQALPAGLARGRVVDVIGAKAVSKRTRPPPRFTDATLLTAMETAGRALEEKELSDAMRELGLGTPATRAQILETLIKREYVVRQAKTLEATEKGVGLVAVVHPDVKSPAMTGEWEAKLRRMQRGDGDLPRFIAGIEAYVREVVARVADRPPMGEPEPQNALASEVRPPEAERRTRRPDELRALLRESFGFPEFRPYQEAVCRSATLGRNLLLVMPTGAGKSLCYQLPGFARGGTTLVVSPLIALMEDQAAKLVERGFRAARIHSGRSRMESRQVCVEYLAGRLDYLFIAPERLRVPGFPEMLARRTPSLVAVDEAHCISQWGHDFRPDYRMLGARLAALRPAPIVALTATATPMVQDDIVAQLGLVGAERFIHGFRRDNLAIEIVEMGPGERPDAVRELLTDPARRPAIVYAATRKSAEELAANLGRRLAAPYHAGMTAAERDSAQAAFLSGKLEVIVATTAFGMGIDKADVRTVIHAALPASLEGYYQEIGRAGRDGKPSIAVLLHSFVDRKTHLFFHERDYPDPAMLEAIHSKLTKKPVAQDKLRKKARMDLETFEKALEKLGIHGGAEVSVDGEVSKGHAAWTAPYVAQRAHKLEALEVMGRFAASNDCRMVRIVRHFGDQEDTGEPCGLCDVCAPARCVARRFREPSRAETDAIARIIQALALGEQATGRLHRETFPDGSLDRRSFEHLIGGLVRAGLVSIAETSFEKGGESIRYQRASLTPLGRCRDEATNISLAPLPAPKKPGKKRPFGKKAFGKTPLGKKAAKAGKWVFIQKANAKKKKRGRK